MKMRSSLLLLSVGLAVALGACSREDAGSKAVKSSARRIQTGEGGGKEGSESDARTKVYSKVVSDLKAGTDPKDPAALVLTSTSNLGLSTDLAAGVVTLEKKALNMESDIRRLGTRWAERQAAAAAASTFDPAPDLKRIADEKTSLLKQIAEQQQKLTASDKQIADLRAAAKSKLDSAAALRAEYTKLKDEAAKTTATAGVDIMKNAAIKRREADRLTLEGMTTQTRADLAAPESEDIRLDIQRMQNQIKELESGGKSLEDKLAAARVEAGAAIDAANKAAAEADKQLTELRTFRSGELKSAIEAAIAKREQALTSSKQAKTDARSGATPIVAQTQQLLADAHLSRAISLRAHALLLKGMADVKPPMPKAADYAKEAESVSADYKSAIADAVASLEEAKSSFEAVRAKGDTADRLKEVAEKLEKLRKALAGEPMDEPTPAPKEDGEAPAEGQASDAPADGSGTKTPTADPSGTPDK
jgi:chromosome segregation ATPase